MTEHSTSLAPASDATVQQKPSNLVQRAIQEIDNLWLDNPDQPKDHEPATDTFKNRLDPGHSSACAEDEWKKLSIETATILNKQVKILIAQGRYEEAKPLCQQVCIIRKSAFGPTHPDVFASLNNLARIYRCLNKKQGKPTSVGLPWT